MGQSIRGIAALAGFFLLAAGPLPKRAIVAKSHTHGQAPAPAGLDTFVMAAGSLGHRW